MEKPPGWVEAIVGTLFNPGGDPDAIRHAAAACRELSTSVWWSAEELKPTTARLADNWEGKGSKAFQKVANAFAKDLISYSDYLEEAADGLKKMADFIEEAQRQAKILWISIAATLAAGAAFTFVTAGLSNAASAAAAAGELTGLAALAARMAFVLSSQAWALGVIQSAMATVAARFAMGFAFSLASSVAVKGVFQGENVLDPANWNANDMSKLLLDGTLVIGLGTVAKLGPVASKLAGPTGVSSLRRDLAGGAVFGASGSAMFSFVSQFGFGGKSLSDPHAWIEMAASSGIGFVSGVGSAGLFHGAPTRPQTGTAPRIKVDVKKDDVMRGFTGSLSDVINYIINYPKPPETPGMHAIQDLDAPEVPAVPDPSPAPTLGGGTHSVRAGESLSAIAQRVYGDEREYWRIAEANHIGPPHTIHPGQDLKIPRVPVGVS